MLTLSLPVDKMYILWLSGLSIRKIAKAYNVGRMAVYGALVRSYGKDCCSLRRQSLARVVYKEYGDLMLAMTARGIDGLYRTQKTEDNYSKLQSTDLSEYHLAAPVVPVDTWLRLGYYREVSRLTTKLVYLTMMARMNRMNK